MKRLFVIHPVALAIYPVLFLFAQNISELSSESLWLPLAVIVVFTCIFWFILTYIMKDAARAGLIVSLFLILFFSYGHLDNHIKAIFIFWPVLFCLGIILIVRIKNNILNVTNVFNIIAAALLIISLAQIGMYQVKTRRVSPTTSNPTNELKIPQTSRAVDALPNIFYIILDAYARADVLEEIYGYDNSEFLNFLDQKGFYVAHQATSNYCQTFLTLASSLNMKYLNDLVGMQLDINANGKQPLMEMIRQSKVTQFLRQRGYTIATFSADIIDPKSKNSYLYLDPGWTLDKFQNGLLNTTPIPSLLKVLGTSNLFDLHRKRIHFIFNRLVDLATVQGPLFVFAHIEAPHPPFVFGPQGEERNDEEKFNANDGDWLIAKGRLTRNEYVKDYIDQLVYINKRTEVTLDGILSHSKNPPIIILSADHGPRSMLVWEDPDKTYMKECMSILNAYYLPNGGKKYLYNEITPVNTFRLIFNYYFGTNYKTIKDESYFSTANYCYKFYDVTDRTKKENRPLVYTNLGNDAIRQGDLAKAIHYFSEALMINPNYADAHEQLSFVYFNQKKYREAIPHLKRATRLEPEKYLLHSYLGAAYFKLNQLQEAIPHFEKAIEIKSDFVPAHINLGNALLQLGRLEDAIDHYRAALRIEPNLAEAYNSLGVALVRQGRFDESIPHFHRALQLRPDWPLALNNLAWIFATHKNPKIRDGEEALQLAQKACELTDYKKSNFLDTLAAAYAEEAQFNKAIQSAQKAMQLAYGSNRFELAKSIEERLQLYEAGKPFHENSNTLTP